MKKTIYYIGAGIALLMLLISCDKNEEVYNDTDCHLNFLYYSEWIEGEVPANQVEWALGKEYYMSRYSFAYSGDTQRDTIWFEVGTMGFLADETRPVALEQVMVDSVNNAIENLHYVAFDSPELAALYRIPTKQNKTRIPVVVLRNDTDLKDTTVVLHFRFKDNGYFSAGYAGLDFRVLEITDRLAKPGNWDPLMMDMYIGTYGEKMHELMIKWTGDMWDDAFVEAYAATDTSYKMYMLEWFNRKLDEENAIRLADPEIGDVYREKNGKPVKFMRF